MSTRLLNHKKTRSFRLVDIDFPAKQQTVNLEEVENHFLSHKSTKSDRYQQTPFNIHHFM